MENQRRASNQDILRGRRRNNSNALQATVSMDNICSLKGLTRQQYLTRTNSKADGVLPMLIQSIEFGSSKGINNSTSFENGFRRKNIQEEESDMGEPAAKGLKSHSRLTLPTNLPTTNTKTNSLRTLQTTSKQKIGASSREDLEQSYNGQKKLNKLSKHTYMSKGEVVAEARRAMSSVEIIKNDMLAANRTVEVLTHPRHVYAPKTRNSNIGRSGESLNLSMQSATSMKSPQMQRYNPYETYESTFTATLKTSQEPKRVTMPIRPYESLRKKQHVKSIVIGRDGKEQKGGATEI